MQIQSKTHTSTNSDTRLRMICRKNVESSKKKTMGINENGYGGRNIAKLTSYCGNRYYFVAKKPV